MTAFTVIIPARQASTRLPGKMLADLSGKPMIVRVAERAAASDALRIVVACDHIDIHHACAKHGVTSILTSQDHPSGTDRLAQAAQMLDLKDQDIVVNVQGDEPLIDPQLINSVADALQRDAHASIATCAAPIQHAAALFNPNIVKVVCDASGHALYFSRAPIPWHRDSPAYPEQVQALNFPARHHIGLYAYRVGFLLQYPKLPSGVLERIESLEQLRALEHGFKIAVHHISTHPGAGVDTAEDLIRVQDIFRNMNQSG